MHTKKFTINVLAFILPLLLIGGGIEILLRSIPNDYSYKKNYLDRNSSKIEVLFLGSSHAYRGINPEFIDFKSFNAAYVSQQVQYDHEIIKKYDGHWDNLKYIVMSISYFSLFSNMEESGESWRIKNYLIYYKMNTSRDAADYFELTSNDFGINAERIESYYRYGKSDVSTSNLGWGRFKANQKFKDDGKIAAKRHTKDIKDNLVFEENLDTLNAIIDYAKQRNIIILFYTPPAFHTYVDNLNQKQLNKMIETMQLIDNQHDNVMYLNLLTDNSFTESDFFNSDHLNETGAKKLTKKINQILISIHD